MGVYKESKSPKSKGKKLDRMTISRAEEGGHVVEHHYADDGLTYHKPTRYVFGQDEGGEMVEHVAKHMHVNHLQNQEDGEPD